MDEREYLTHMRAGASDAHAKEIRHFEEMQVYMADLRRKLNRRAEQIRDLDREIAALS